MHILVYNILWVLVVIGKGCVHREREREREREKERKKERKKERGTKPYKQKLNVIMFPLLKK